MVLPQVELLMPAIERLASHHTWRLRKAVVECLPTIQVPPTTYRTPAPHHLPDERRPCTHPSILPSLSPSLPCPTSPSFSLPPSCFQVQVLPGHPLDGSLQRLWGRLLSDPVEVVRRVAGDHLCLAGRLMQSMKGQAALWPIQVSHCLPLRIGGLRVSHPCYVRARRGSHTGETTSS